MHRGNLLFDGYRVVYYARVSTEEEEQLNAIELQIEENRTTIRELGGKLVDEYVDRGKSGTTVKKRDEYQRLYEDMYKDKFDIICIKDQDRLMRNTKDWYLFVDRLLQTGKRLYIYLEGKFFTPAEDALITGIKAIMAEEYSRNLSKKLHNYHNRRKEKAKAGEKVRLQGSGNVYGWDKKDGAYVINPEQAKVRRLMCELVLQGKGSTEVANILNNMGYRNTVGKLWKAQSIPQMVYDEKNIGVMIINRERKDFSTKKVTFNPPEEWIRIENAFPPIITPEEWSELCKIRESRVNYYGCKKRGKKVSGYSFSGKIICGECGSTYWRKQKSKDCSQEYWTCSRKIQNGGKIRKKTTANGNAGEVNPNGCDNETISYSDLMKVMQIIADQLSANTGQIKEDMLQWLYSLRESIMKKSSVYSQVDLNRELSRKDRLLDSYLDGVISKEDYQRKNEELENKISVIEEDLKGCEEKTEDIKDIDRIIDNIDEEISQYITEEKNLKIDFVLKYLESVVMFPDRVIVNIPVIGSEVIVEKVQFVNRKKCTYLQTANLRSAGKLFSRNKELNIYYKLVA